MAYCLAVSSLTGNVVPFRRLVCADGATSGWFGKHMDTHAHTCSKHEHSDTRTVITPRRINHGVYSINDILHIPSQLQRSAVPRAAPSASPHIKHLMSCNLEPV